MKEEIPYVIDIIGTLTTKRTKIKFRNNSKTYSPLPITINQSFFKGWDCMMCGKCCRIKTDFVLEEITPELADKFLSTDIVINGQVKQIYYYKKDKDGCCYLKENRCTIHEKKPLQCIVHPIHVDKMKDKLYLHKRQYKRNWRFGCKMCFNIYTENERQKDIYFFQRLLQLADRLEIKTYIPSILNYLKSLDLTNIPSIIFNSK